MSFDLKQLKAFDAVARCGGFSRASEEIGLTQPTLSTHIKNLEASLGVRLFDRASRNVNLTPTGAVLAQYARRILDLCAQSREAVEAFSGQISGSVRVEASTVPGEYLLPRRLVDFKKRYPQVQVILTVSDSSTVLSRVQKGEISLGVTGTVGTEPLLEYHLICEDSLVFVISPDTPGEGRDSVLGLDDLDRLPLIRREPGSGTQLALENALAEQGINPEKVKWTSTLGSTRAVIEGVLSGLGGAFVSRSAAAREIASGTLVEIPVRGIVIKRGLYVVRHRQKTLSPAEACFMEELLRPRSDPEVLGN